MTAVYVNSAGRKEDGKAGRAATAPLIASMLLVIVVVSINAAQHRSIRCTRMISPSHLVSWPSSGLLYHTKARAQVVPKDTDFKCYKHIFDHPKEDGQMTQRKKKNKAALGAHQQTARKPVPRTAHCPTDANKTPFKTFGMKPPGQHGHNRQILSNHKHYLFHSVKHNL